MADLSLDEIIATKKGPNMKQKQITRKQFQRKPNQQGGQPTNPRLGFVAKVNRLGGIQRKPPFSAPIPKGKVGNLKGGPTQNKGTKFGGPGRGQIDARDMITIKNRIKIPDARAKIIQKRINQGKLVPSSNLQAQNQQQVNPRPVRPQQINTQAGLWPQNQPPRPPGQQRFQQPRQPFQQPRPQFQQQGPRLNQQFNRPQGQGFNLQQAQQFNRQQGPNFSQQQSPQFNQQPPQFNQQASAFNQPVPDFIQDQGPPFSQSQHFSQEQGAPFNQQGPQFNQEQDSFMQEQSPEFCHQDSQFGQQPFQVNPNQQFNQQPPQFSQQPQQFNQPPQMNRPPQNFNQGPPGHNRPRPVFNQPPSGFDQGQLGFKQPRPNFSQSGPGFNQRPPNMAQPPPGFNQPHPQFNNPSHHFQGPPDEDDGGADFILEQPGNPSANGSTVVEDTGTSLKITRSIPDVTFDDGKLTVTRRLPVGSQNQMPAQSAYKDGLPRPQKFIASGPVKPTQKKKFQPTPIQAPVSSDSVVKAQPGPAPIAKRPPVPITAPVSTRVAVQPPNPTEPVTNTRFKIVKTLSTSAPAPVTRTLHSAPQQQSRLKPPPQTSPAVSLPNRPTQSAFSRIQQQTHGSDPTLSRIHHQAQSENIASSRFHVQNTPMSSRLSAPNVPISERLAPHPSASSQPAQMSQSVSVARTAVKRPAAMSLSERFGSGGTGNPIPVITDHAPIKKRRATDEFEKAGYEEEIEVKKQFQAHEMEEEPGTTVLSPLQGFRILVSNLHASVTQDDIIELFGSLGPLKRANLLTKGQAEVAFIHKEHALMALKTYHNRELDGQPMFVKLTTPLNAKVMQVPSSEDSPVNLPAALRTKKLPVPVSAPVEIPLIHKALFKTASEAAPSKAVRFTVKL